MLRAHARTLERKPQTDEFWQRVDRALLVFEKDVAAPRGKMTMDVALDESHWPLVLATLVTCVELNTWRRHIVVDVANGKLRKRLTSTLHSLIQPRLARLKIEKPFTGVEIWKTFVDPDPVIEPRGCLLAIGKGEGVVAGDVTVRHVG